MSALNPTACLLVGMGLMFLPRLTLFVLGILMVVAGLLA